MTTNVEDLACLTYDGTSTSTIITPWNAQRANVLRTSNNDVKEYASNKYGVEVDDVRKYGIRGIRAYLEKYLFMVYILCGNIYFLGMNMVMTTYHSE